jgi:uncharacterized protein YbjT (DUF2867 family)
MKPILVIGATGTVGRQVASQLAARGVAVRALARNPEAAGLPPEVEVVRGDLTVPESLDGCLDGVDTMFVTWTAPASAVDGAWERIAKRARRIVYLSAPIKTPHPLFQASQPNPGATLHARIERLIADAGVDWTFVRPGMFAANALFWWAAQIRAGGPVRWPCLSAPTAPIDERDTAAVAVRVLCEDGHAGADYVITGPESLTQRAQISIICRAIGREARIEEMTPDEALQELSHFPAYVLKYLLISWEAATGQPAWITSTVEQVTGASAHTFLQWATDHASAFRA